MDPAPSSNVVKLGDILPALASFESVLGSLKSYRLWPVVLREALLDRAISGIPCDPMEEETAWGVWCRRNEVNPEAPVFEGLSVIEMRSAASREKRIEKFKEQAFGKLLPEYFRSRKADLDRVTLELVQFHHLPVAEEAFFRCSSGEQSLEEAARELAHRDGGEPPVKKIGPISLGRLGAGLATLIAGASPHVLLGPKKIGYFHCLVRILEKQEATLDERMRGRLLDELLNQWVEQQMSAMTGRAPRQAIQEG
jgi:hypothetical protein